LLPEGPKGGRNTFAKREGGGKIPVDFFCREKVKFLLGAGDKGGRKRGPGGSTEGEKGPNSLDRGKKVYRIGEANKETLSKKKRKGEISWARSEVVLGCFGERRAILLLGDRGIEPPRGPEKGWGIHCIKRKVYACSGSKRKRKKSRFPAPGEKEPGHYRNTYIKNER